MKYKTVFIIGPDGVGKTTQIKLLIKDLKSRGIIYEYRWLRFNHFVSLPLLALARLMGLSEKIKFSNGTEIGYHYFYRSNLISTLYIFTLSVDVVISVFTKYYIPVKILKKNIIYDRFLFDTLIDLMISTGKHKLYKSRIGDLFSKLVPVDGVTILLIGNEDELRKRRDDVKHDKCLSLKIKLYKEISEKYEISTIKTNGSEQQVHQEIKKSLMDI